MNLSLENPISFYNGLSLREAKTVIDRRLPWSNQEGFSGIYIATLASKRETGNSKEANRTMNEGLICV